MKKKLGIVLLIAAMGILGNMLSGRDGEKADLAALVKDGAVLIDTHTAEEFGMGHLPGSINLPYDLIPRDIPLVEQDHSKSIIVYCESGARSDGAKKLLASMGYTNVVNGGTIGNVAQALAR